MSESSGRRYDVDWLRVGATYLLFVFHVAKVFDPAPFYHIRNGDLSMAMLILAGFIGLWHMPLFFVLAGWSIFESLRAHGMGGFVRERWLRLFVPLVAGAALFGPPIKYLELSTGLDANYAGLFVAPELQSGFRQVIPQGLPLAAPFSQTFFEFWPTFYRELHRFTWAHLWFLAYLFTFSLLYAPVFGWLSRRPGRVPQRVAAAWVYLPIVPIAATQVFLRPYWPGLQNLYDDWANVAMYSVYLFAGFAIARSPELEGAVHREWKRAFAIALAAMAVLIAGVAGAVSSAPLLLAATGVAGRCFIVGLLGFARSSLSFSNRALSYLVESALPVYVLHQAAIVIPGFWIVQLRLGIGAKFALLLVVSVALTMAAYEVIRRFLVTRFLFGMRPPSARAQPWMTVRKAAAGVGLVIGAAGALVALTPSRSAAGASPLGTWLAEGGAATVEISPCGAALCGRVAWLRSPIDSHGCGLRDERNPDPALRDRPVVGIEVLTGLMPRETGRWAGGTIYDPSSGNTYRCEATLDEADRLDLRGYIGIPLIGRTTTWIRLGAEERMCAASRQ